MKVLIPLSLLVASASAFMPIAPRSTSTRLFAATTAEEAIIAAKKASEEFGASSPEAAIAWELVEELDAAKAHSKPAPAKEEAPVAEETKSAGKDIEISSEYDAALAEAKKVTEEKGISSPEAALAWELVEELSATRSHHKTTGQG